MKKVLLLVNAKSLVSSIPSLEEQARYFQKHLIGKVYYLQVKVIAFEDSAIVSLAKRVASTIGNPMPFSHLASGEDKNQLTNFWSQVKDSKHSMMLGIAGPEDLKRILDQSEIPFIRKKGKIEKKTVYFYIGELPS